MASLFYLGNSIWAFKYIPLPAVKADAQGMCERPQNRLLLKVKPAVGHSDFLIPQYTWIFFSLSFPILLPSLSVEDIDDQNVYPSVLG